MRRVLVIAIGVVAALALPAGAAGAGTGPGTGHSVSPQSLFLGEVSVGASTSQTVTLHLGDNEIFGSYEKVGPDSIQFDLNAADEAACHTVVGSASCPFRITFTPNELGEQSATFIFAVCTPDGGACPNLQVPVSGTGLAAATPGPGSPPPNLGSGSPPPGAGSGPPPLSLVPGAPSSALTPLAAPPAVAISGSPRLTG